MLRPVTAGLDGSRESLAAAGWAAREALRRDLPLRLVRADAWPQYDMPTVLDDDIRQLRYEEAFRAVLTEIRGRHPQLAVTADFLSDAAVPALLRAADQAESLVLGSRGLSGITGVLVGSVGLAVTARARCPVVLVRSGEAGQDDEHQTVSDRPLPGTAPHRRIVLGLDISRPCDELIRFAFETAAVRGATLDVAYAWPFPPPYGPESGWQEFHTDKVVPASWAEAAHALATTLRPWREKYPDVPVADRITAGRAARHLPHVAVGADLVVLGRRQRRRVLGPRLGPVAHTVLHQAPCPVAVVPHD